MHTVTLTDREHAFLLAALRVYQAVLDPEGLPDGGPPRAEQYEEIRTCGGELEPLEVEEANGLAERLNMGGPDLLEAAANVMDGIGSEGALPASDERFDRLYDAVANARRK